MVALLEGIVANNDSGVPEDPVVSNDITAKDVEAKTETNDTKETDRPSKETERTIIDITANDDQEAAVTVAETPIGEIGEQEGNKTTPDITITAKSETETNAIEPKEEEEEEKKDQKLPYETSNGIYTTTTTNADATTTTTATAATTCDAQDRTGKPWRKRIGKRIKKRWNKMLDDMVEYDNVARKEKRDVLDDLFGSIEGKVCGGVNCAATLAAEKRGDYSTFFEDPRFLKVDNRDLEEGKEEVDENTVENANGVGGEEAEKVEIVLKKTENSSWCHDSLFESTADNMHRLVIVI